MESNRQKQQKQKKNKQQKNIEIHQPIKRKKAKDINKKKYRSKHLKAPAHHMGVLLS